MEYFKHFTNGHSSTPMRKVIKKFGLEGYACYFILLELCFDKIKKARDEEFTEDHFEFRLEETEVLQKFRMRATRVELLLNFYVTCGLLLFTKVEDEFHFEIPKILELLDREQRRARPKSGADRAECGPEEKRREESRIEENKKKKTANKSPFDFEAAYAQYPVRIKGPKAEKQFSEQIKTQQDFDDLLKAIANYKQMLAIEDWRKPKGTFAAFLGTKGTHYFWRDWINWEVPVKPQGHSNSWDEEAGYIVQALKKFTSDQGYSAKEWLGEERWRAVELCGGWRTLALKQLNDWTKKEIIKACKQALSKGA